MSLLRATAVHRAPVAGAAVDRVVLDYESRLVRRKRLTAAGGLSFVVDLPEVVSLGPGDALALEDGRLIAVEAEAERLLEVTGDLPRLAWHLGNRHTPCQIEPARLLIRDEPVARAMLARLDAEVREVTVPFQPEGGAYGHGRVMGHSHEPAGGHSSPFEDFDGDGDPGVNDRRVLEQWLAAAAPAAARGVSQCLERAVAAGDVACADDLAAWLADMLRLGAGRTEAVLLSGALQGGDPDTLAQLGRALASASPRREPASAPCRALADAVEAAIGAVPTTSDWPCPVTVGVAARRLDLARQEVVETYLQAFASGPVAAATRLLPPEPAAAQAVLAALRPVIAGVAAEALSMNLDAIAHLAQRAEPASGPVSEPDERLQQS